MRRFSPKGSAAASGIRLPFRCALVFGAFLIVGMGSDAVLAGSAFETDRELWEAHPELWRLTGAKFVTTDDGQPAIACRESGDLAVAAMFIPPGELVRVSVSVECEEVRPAGSIGYGYAAVYQYDEAGGLIRFEDFAQVTGTQPWKSYVWEGRLERQAFRIELRLGLHQARGLIRFCKIRIDSLNAPEVFEWERTPVPNLALLLESAAPFFSTRTNVRALERVLSSAGYRVERFSFEDLAAAWHPLRFRNVSILVFPDAPYFPLLARAGLLRFLSEGVDMLTLGGYAFDIPVTRTKSGWIEVGPVNEPLSALGRLRDGSFEESLHNPTKSPWERSAEAACRFDTDHPHTGKAVAKAVLAQRGSATFRQSVLNVRPGDTVRLTGWVRTDNVSGPGYAFVAIYPFAKEQWVQPRDVVNLRGTHDWQKVTALVKVPPGADRVEVRMGLFEAVGTAYFDDFQLELVEFLPVVNTHWGHPEDGLNVTPWQLGLFDADAPLEQPVELQAPSWRWSREEPLKGYSAVGVLRRSARWQPIVEAFDRWGRRAGTAGALMSHFAGPFRGSRWAFFGLEDVDLLTLPGFSEQVLLPLLVRMQRGVGISRASTEYACYRPGETPVLKVVLDHFGQEPFGGCLVARVYPLDGQADAERQPVVEQDADLSRMVPGESREVQMPLTGCPPQQGMYRVELVLKTRSDEVQDQARVGFVIWDGKTLPGKLDFAYRDNYFHRDGRPRFFCGTTTWSNWFVSPGQSDPLFWAENLRHMRDSGIDFVANLQTWWHPPYQLGEAEWRQLDAMVYLCHRAGVIYRAGLFVGQDVAVETAVLEQQAAFSREFARRYRHLDGLIYYLNGDYQLRPKNEKQHSWEWQVTQTRRWNETLTAAIRQEDPIHPIISEYYQVPVGGLDLRKTLDGLDVAEIGYFGPPQRDLKEFAATFKWIDHRLIGKSAAVGEFGVKTHPAWAAELGATGYHIRRSRAEQERLFLLLPQYVFALGGSAARNWCWRDDDDRVFPWGLLRMRDQTERPALRFYRAASFLLSHLPPQWRPPEVLLITPDAASAEEAEAAREATLLACEVLLSLKADFAIVGDHDLQENHLTGVKAVVVPAAISRQAEELLNNRGRGLRVIHEKGLGASNDTDPAQGETRVEMLRRQWEEHLAAAGVRRIRVSPESPQLQAFHMPLASGEAYVFINASDQPAEFEAVLPDETQAAMRLEPWYPGLLAVDSKGDPFALEGSGRMMHHGQVLAEADGPVILLSAQEGQPLTGADRLWLISVGAREVRLYREKAAGASLEVGRFIGGMWHTFGVLSIERQRNTPVVRIPADLTGELVLVRWQE